LNRLNTAIEYQALNNTIHGYPSGTYWVVTLVFYCNEKFTVNTLPSGEGKMRREEHHSGFYRVLLLVIEHRSFRLFGRKTITQ